MSLLKKTEHGFKSQVLRLLAAFLRRGDSSRWPVDPQNVRSILVLRPDKLGDMIVSVPVLHVIKKMYPHIRVEVIASPGNVTVIREDPLVDEVHLYSKNIFKDLPMVRRLTKKPFDIVYDPNCLDSVTGLALSHLIGKSALLVASRKNHLGRFYDFCKPFELHGDDHNIDNGLLLLHVLGQDPAQVDPFQPVFIPKVSQDKADQFFQSFQSGGRLIVGVNVSAGDPSRVLSSDKYAALVQSIASRNDDYMFVIICTPADRKRAESILEQIAAPAVLIPDGLSLLDVAAIIERLGALISPDTSLIHFARLASVPVVGLYTNHKRNYEFFKPYRQDRGSVIAATDANIHDITPDAVADEFFRLINALTVRPGSKG